MKFLKNGLISSLAKTDLTPAKLPILDVSPHGRRISLQAALACILPVFISGADVEAPLISFLRLDRFSFHHVGNVFLLCVIRQGTLSISNAFSRAPIFESVHSSIVRMSSLRAPKSLILIA